MALITMHSGDISDKGLAIKELVNIPGFWTENETFELSWVVGPTFCLSVMDSIPARMR